MRASLRDKRPVAYAFYSGMTELTDTDNNYTGEYQLSYTTPVRTLMNVSGGRGQADVSLFGLTDTFARTAVTDDLTTEFDTDTIFWFGVTPGNSYDDVPHNYRCTGVARTINGCLIALEELDVTHEDNTPIVSG